PLLVIFALRVAVQVKRFTARMEQVHFGVH
ncbi:unnamed protein product, partial [marine sediment metagenome]